MSIPYIAKYAGPTIGDATKDILREYGMTGHEIGSRAECQYTFMEFSEFVQRKVGDDIWHSLKYPTSAIYKAVADYMKEEEYEVDDIIAARDHLKASGLRVLGDGEPKIGAHGKPVIFLHPKDMNGTLTELEQV